MTAAKGHSHWFHARLSQFALKKEARLPYDAHFLAALVAPRSLVTTEGLADKDADPVGTQETYRAAKVVYDWLGAPEKIGLHFRKGHHRQGPEDWAAMMDFADQVFFDKKPENGRTFNKLPFPEEKLHFSWKAPKKEVTGKGDT
jgi:hypothetical protein